jgi:hypothetical protein
MLVDWPACGRPMVVLLACSPDQLRTSIVQRVLFDDAHGVLFVETRNSVYRLVCEPDAATSPASAALAACRPASM